MSWCSTDKDDTDNGRLWSVKRDSKTITVHRRSSSGENRDGSKCQEERELTSRTRVSGELGNVGLKKA